MKEPDKVTGTSADKRRKVESMGQLRHEKMVLMSIGERREAEDEVSKKQMEPGRTGCDSRKAKKDGMA